MKRRNKKEKWIKRVILNLSKREGWSECRIKKEGYFENWGLVNRNRKIEWERGGRETGGIEKRDNMKG